MIEKNAGNKIQTAIEKHLEKRVKYLLINLGKLGEDNSKNICKKTWYQWADSNRHVLTDKGF